MQGSGPALVLVPGLACSHLYYVRLQRHLAAHFEVWAYDPPGHGLTPAPPGAYLDAGSLARHLAGWLRATGLMGVPLFGHSQGGEVLLHLASTSPDLASHLVLCAPSGREETAPTARLLGHLLLDIRHERPGFLMRLLRSYVRTGVRRSWKLLRAGRHDVTFRLAAQVRSPTLILEGELDRVVRRDALLRLSLLLPNARRVRIRGGGTRCMTAKRRWWRTPSLPLCRGALWNRWRIPLPECVGRPRGQ